MCYVVCHDMLCHMCILLWCSVLCCRMSRFMFYLMLYVVLWYDTAWRDRSIHPSLNGFPSSQAKNYTLSYMVLHGLTQSTDPASSHITPANLYTPTMLAFFQFCQTKSYSWIPQDLCISFWPKKRPSPTSQPLWSMPLLCQTLAPPPKPSLTPKAMQTPLWAPPKVLCSSHQRAQLFRAYAFFPGWLTDYPSDHRREELGPPCWIPSIGHSAWHRDSIQ